MNLENYKDALVIHYHFSGIKNAEIAEKLEIETNRVQKIINKYVENI